MDEHLVHDDERRHRLNDGHRTGHDTGIVPPTGSELAGSPVVLRSLLLLRDRRGRLEADAEVDVLPVRDPALHAPAPVRGRAEGAVRAAHERVVVLRAGHLRPAEAGADLERLRRGDGEHRVPELRLELVEDGLAEPCGDAADDAGDGPADRVVCLLCADDALQQDVLARANEGEVEAHAYLDHALRRLGVRTARRLCVNGLARHRLEELDELGAERVLDGVVVVHRDLRRGRDGGGELHLPYGGHERHDLDAVRQLQVLLRDRARGDAPCALVRWG